MVKGVMSTLAKVSQFSNTLSKVGKSFDIIARAFKELQALNEVWQDEPKPITKTILKDDSTDLGKPQK